MWSLRSRSSQGHSHFKVKVILQSNVKVFQFLSRSGRLAFVRMLILLVCTTGGTALKIIKCVLQLGYMICLCVYKARPTTLLYRLRPSVFILDKKDICWITLHLGEFLLHLGELQNITLL